MLHEGLQAGFVDEQIVRRHAGLPGIDGLHLQYPRRRRLQVIVLADDNGRLAAQLQGHRGQIARCRLHDPPPRFGRASKDQMVERHAGKCRAADVGDDRQGMFGKVLLHQAMQQGAKITRVGRHLDDAAVARRQGAGDGADDQVQRIVPRRDDADHALGLWHDRIARAEKPPGAMPTLRLHPSGQALAAVTDAIDREKEFQQLGFLLAAVAEVQVDRGADGVLVIEQDSLQALEVIEAILQGWNGVVTIGRVL
ncbi:hypothetical protein FQZ97_746860 [compost metagenome]